MIKLIVTVTAVLAMGAAGYFGLTRPNAAPEAVTPVALAGDACSCCDCGDDCACDDCDCCDCGADCACGSCCGEAAAAACACDDCGCDDCSGDCGACACETCACEDCSGDCGACACETCACEDCEGGCGESDACCSTEAASACCGG